MAEAGARGSVRGALAAEDVLLVPLPRAADAALAVDAWLVSDHLLGQIVGREVAVDLTHPRGPVIHRVTWHAGRLAAQPGQFGHRGLDTGGDMQHRAAREVAFQGGRQRPGDVVNMDVVTR